MDLLDYTPSTDDVVITLKVNETVLKNADGSDMTITFYSPYSKESKKIKHDMVDSRIEQAEKSGQTRLSSSEVDTINTVSMAKNIKEWNLTSGGKALKLTEKNAIDTLDKAFWIKDLYDKAVENSLGFMKG